MALSVSAIATRYPIWPSSHNITGFLVKRHTPNQTWKTMASTSSTHDKVTAPYGSWKSPVTADVVSGAEKRLGGTSIDDLGRLFWIESRPSESGRSVLLKAPEKPGDEPVDITPKEFLVRTVTQEYGGGAFKIVGDDVIFSNYKDQRLYKQSIESIDSFPFPLTPDYGGPLVSYADGEFDPHFKREDGREDHLNPTTIILSIDLNDQNIQEPGNDFYAFPHLDPKRERIAWIQWGRGTNQNFGLAIFLRMAFQVNKGKVDGERLCIVGGSAGGYTTLVALAFRETFKAGASLYGIADLTLMRAETHKFESHYLDNLVDDYFQRSPINFVNKFSCPILLLQGLEDKVVPPNQARKIYHALKEKGLPVALVEFEGEQHGFRKAETIKFALEAWSSK